MMNGLAESLLDLPRPAKRLLVLGFDALLCVLTAWLALSVRLESLVGIEPPLLLAAGVSLMALPIFVTSGLYRAIFRYRELQAIMAVVRAVGLYGLVYAGLFTIYGVPDIPRSIGVSQPLLLLVAVGGLRAIAWKWLGGSYKRRLNRREVQRVMVYGAGSAGRQLVAALNNAPEMHPVGFLDDNAELQGQILKGITIHKPEHLKDLLQKLDVDLVLLAMPSASRQRRNQILELARQANVQVRTLPGMGELANGQVSVSDLRELDIEDLLGRDPVPPQTHLLDKNIRGKVVLVTGAGGSIGSELCRQILKSQPAQLLLLELSEYALYSVHQSLSKVTVNYSQTDIIPLLGSVQNAQRLREIMQCWHPHTVYHAAAYKHVPLVEHNPAEGVQNNVFGTLTTAQIALEQGVEDFVLISTDKAVRPTNIMGATKRLAEMTLQALAAESDCREPREIGAVQLPPRRRAGEQRTRFTMVRFGNVLGSSGSVVPLFRQQIKDGGPITLTHADITRYFMTIPEAAQLVIQAGAMASGGDVFVLDMGEPVRIIDLARRMVELSGLSVRDDSNPNGDIEIQVSGLRPGEKLYEELLIGDNPLPTPHPRIMKAHEDFLPWVQLDKRLQAIQAALSSQDVQQLRAIMQELVHDYQPEGAVVDWIHLNQSQCIN